MLSEDWKSLFQHRYFVYRLYDLADCAESADFEHGIQFSFTGGKVKLTGSGGFENNVEVMHLQEAYQIHDVDAKELIDKSRTYTESQLKEIQALLASRKRSVSMKKLKEHITEKACLPTASGGGRCLSLGMLF